VSSLCVITAPFQLGFMKMPRGKRFIPARTATAR
jgi:hypothetical protein